MALLSSASALADIVTLPNGSIECEVVNIDSAYTRLRLPSGGILMVCTDSIRDIIFSNPAQAGEPELVAPQDGDTVGSSPTAPAGTLGPAPRPTFTPDRIGVRQTPAPDSGHWSSSPGATVVQSACGCSIGASAVVAGIGILAGDYLFGYLEPGDGEKVMYVTLGLIPAVTATGVVGAGWRRGRPGGAYLGAYVGAAALGALGYLFEDVWPGLVVGVVLGSTSGAVIGYNVR